MRPADWFLPPLIALTLLTRLPVFSVLPDSIKKLQWSEKQQGLSVLWYPIVGFLLAVILYSVCIGFSFLPDIVLSAIILLLWIMLTGALHLDGFADSIDAAYAAHNINSHDASTSETNKEQQQKILKVFKDPACGAMAVVALILLLLLKFVALFSIIAMASDQFFLVFTLTLVLARCAAMALMATTPYAGKGLGLLINYLPLFWVWMVLGLVFFLFAVIFPFWQFLTIIIALAVLTFLWRRFWLKQLSGIVGDCIGALIEISEVLILLVALMFVFY